jgi:phenylacetate-coenzyme A ligase PaaK-like adenylate-forming protein
MFVYHELYGTDHPDSPTIARVLGAVGAIVALCAVFLIAPRHDATKVVSGLPCSVLSEAEISAALGAPMLLMPTSGAVCRYVSTGSTGAPALFVIARHDTAIPASIAQNGVEVQGVGDAAVRSSSGLYVRYGARAYTFIVVPQGANDVRPIADELRVAKLVHRTMIAQSR